MIYCDIQMDYPHIYQAHWENRNQLATRLVHHQFFVLSYHYIRIAAFRMANALLTNNKDIDVTVDLVHNSFAISVHNPIVSHEAFNATAPCRQCGNCMHIMRRNVRELIACYRAFSRWSKVILLRHCREIYLHNVQCTRCSSVSIRIFTAWKQLVCSRSLCKMIGHFLYAL